MRKRLATLLLLCAATSTSAHHGTPFFDSDTEVRYEGVVLEFDYRNPHSWLYIRTADASGNPLDLAIEGQGSSLRPHGVTPDSLVPGERVTAVVNPSWNKPDEALGRLVFKETARWCRWRGRPWAPTKPTPASPTASRAPGWPTTKDSPHT